MRVLHRVFLLGNRFIMLPLVRAMGGPRDTTLGGRLCLLRTVGRKSGIVREVPLSYSPTTAGIVVLSGFGNGGAWAHNLRARPEAEVQVGRRTYGVSAVEITDPLQAERSTRAVLRDAGVAGFCYGWDPRRASSDRIRRVMPGLVSFHLRFHEPPPWAVCRP